MASHEEYSLPNELENDQEAAVLYAPFREKSLNPQSWTRKMKVWEKLLIETALERRVVTFDVNSLPVIFERKGMKPKCLATVVEEMTKSGKVKSIEHYRKANGWLSWGFNTLVKQPLAWGVGQLFGSPKKETEVYVWPEVVKKLCQEVIELHRANVQNEPTDVLVSMASLRSQCRSLIPRDQDFDIVLVQLERDRKIAITETQDKEMVIKFCKMGEQSVTPITDTNLHIYRIQVTVKKLEEEIEVLAAKAHGQTNEARMHIRENRKKMAMHCLRKKRDIFKMMDRKSGSLTVLYDIVQKIEDASTNEMVVKACEAGVAAVKNLNKDITVEGVESVMDNVKEAIENQEEINEALASSFVTQDDDDDQLERDLELLLSDGLKAVRPVAESEEEMLHAQFNIHIKGDMKRRKRESDTSIASLLNSVEVLGMDDLGLPNVPHHSPSQAGLKEKSKAGSSMQPLPS